MPHLKAVPYLADQPEIVAVGGAVIVGLVLAILYPILIIALCVLPL